MQNDYISLTKEEEKKKFYFSLVFPLALVIIMWIVKFIEIIYNLDFSNFGIYPRSLSGLKGIIAAPFIHGSLSHIIDNSIPLIFLLVATFYFYDKIAFKIFFLIFFMTNFWVWFGARESYHIGASGLVYGFGSFLFFSGIIRRNINLLAISLLVTFLYGSMIWGIFPLDIQVSWESHLMGTIAGLVLSIVYRKEGPQKKEHTWEEEEEELDDDFFADDEKINKLIDSKINKK